MPTKVASGQLTVTDTYDGVVLLLSNDSHTIPSDMLGGTLDLTGCTTTASVISGPNDDTANWALTFTKGTGVSGSVTGATFTVTGLTNDTGYVDVTATRSGFATLTARFSLAKAKRGLEGVSVVLSNEAHTMPADNAGVVGSYTNSGTTLQVFEGSTALTAAANTSANSSFTIGTPVVSPAGKITVGGRSYAGTVATVAQHSAMDAATDTLTISYPITVKRANGTTLTLTRTQTLTKSKAGDQGPQGVRGTDGSTTYTWIKYADSAAGAGLSNDPTGKTYIGLAYNKTTATESTVAADYTWSLIQGDQGIQGPKGDNGVTYYTWLKYSANADGTGLTDTPQSDTKYIGIAVNKTTVTESTNKADYVWSLFKGSDGSNGTNGSNGTRGSVHLFVSVTGSVWSDTPANTALASAPYNGKVIADRVTEYNLSTNFSQCRYWTGSAWSVITEVLDGNLLVTGSVTANKINLNDLYAQNATVTGSLLVGDIANSFVRIGGSTHILAQQASKVLFSVDANGSGFINGAGIGAQTLGPESFSSAAIEFIRGQMGTSAPTGGGVRTSKAMFDDTVITLASLNSNGTVVDLVVSYLASGYGVDSSTTPPIPSVTVTIKRGTTTVATQVFSGTRRRDTSVSSTYWEVTPPNLNMAVQDATPPTGSVVYSVTLALSNIDPLLEPGEVSFGASQATSGGGGGYNTDWANISGKPETATRWPTLAEVGAAATTHYHDASAITSGTLPVTRGGTGRTDGKAVALATARTINGATFDGSSNIFFTSTDSANTRISNPEGGQYTTQASVVTGALAIQLPVGMTNRMLTISVKVYEYKTGETFNIELSGYNYSNGQVWYNTTAVVVGDPDIDRRFAVRFGYDSSADRAIIYIGELNTSWDYPQVAVTDVMVGYSSGGTVWRSGWSIFFETGSFKNVTVTSALKQVGFGDTIASASTLAKRDSSGNLTANSFIGNLTGTAGLADVASQLMVWNGAGQLRTELNSNYVRFRFGGDSSSILGIAITDYETTKILLDRYGRISFGGTFSAGNPTLDSGVGAIGFWPNGAGGGQYKFLNNEMYFPSGMDLRIIASAANGVGFYTAAGAARQTMMFGSVLISSSYGSAERAKVPSNGLFVQGAITSEGKVTSAQLSVTADSQFGARQKRMVVETGVPAANSGVFRTWIRLCASSVWLGVVTLRISVQSNYNWVNASGCLEFTFTGNCTDTTCSAYSWELTTANGNAADNIRIGMPEYRNGDFGFWVYSPNSNSFTVTVDAHASSVVPLAMTQGVTETGVSYPAEVPLIARSGVQTLTGRTYSWTNGSAFGNPETGGFSLDSPLSTFTYLKMMTNGTNRGKLYADSGGIGFLDTSNNWAFRVDMSRNLYTYGALKIGSGFDVQFVDATARLYRNASGRITADVGGTANVLQIANYGLYLPVTPDIASIGLYVESASELRGGVRLGNGAAGGTISSTGLATFKAPVRGTAYANATFNFQDAGLRALTNAATDGYFMSALTLATSTTENYGWTLAAFRNSSSAGRLSFRFHAGSTSGNEIAYMNHIGELFVTDSTTTSDRRLKHDIRRIEGAIQKVVHHLKGSTFMRKGGNYRTAGLMSDEVFKALPEAVRKNDASGYDSVSYNAVLGLVVEALKDIVAEVRTLGGFKWLQ